MARGGRKKKWQNKSLYICTAEYKFNSETRYAIHSIKLTDLLTREEETKGGCSDTSKSISCGLQNAGSIHSNLLPRRMHCGVFGSQILFAGGRDYSAGKSGETSNKIYVFETDLSVDPNPELKEYSPSFLQGKHDPFLVELKGNLYALGGDGVLAGLPTFEVLCKKTQRWYPKRNPPCFEDGRRRRPPPYLSCATAGTKILVSCPGAGDPQVFCYDVAEHHPKELGEWKILSGSDYGLPFLGKALVVDLEDGTNYVLFAYHFFHSYFRNKEDWGIVPYRMSVNDCDSRISIKPIKTKALRKAPVPPEFCNTATSHSFVHLGGRKVCCVISRQISSDDGNSTHKMRIAFITFEFQFTTDEMGNDEFSVKSLTTRICEYHCSKESSSSDIYHATLAGCFQRRMKPSLKEVFDNLKSVQL